MIEPDADSSARVKGEGRIETAFGGSARGEAAGTMTRARCYAISTGKGLLGCVAIVVAGARLELWKRPLQFELLLAD